MSKRIASTMTSAWSTGKKGDNDISRVSALRLTVRRVRAEEGCASEGRVLCDAAGEKIRGDGLGQRRE